jgi:hypothetical protein
VARLLFLPVRWFPPGRIPNIRSPRFRLVSGRWSFGSCARIPLTCANGARTLFAVADRVLGARTRVAAGYVYTIPAIVEDPVAEALLDRIAAEAWTGEREHVLGFLDRIEETEDRTLRRTA